MLTPNKMIKANTFEVLQDFITKQGFTVTPAESGSKAAFNRVLKIQLEDNVFFIEWWVNQSYLKLKDEHSAPHIPFKYVSVNRNSPNAKHKLQLCFFDELREGDKNSMFYNPLPFGAFKIPFNAIP